MIGLLVSGIILLLIEMMIPGFGIHIQTQIVGWARLDIQKRCCDQQGPSLWKEHSSM